MAKAEVSPSGRTSARRAKVFYTIFVDDKAVFPNNPAFPNEEDDKDVASISGSSIPPPHTISSLKRAICKVESITDTAASDIFETNGADEPLDDHQKLDLASETYPGVDPEVPVVLVVKTPDHFNYGVPASRKGLMGKVLRAQEINSPVKTFRGHTSPVNAVTFSPDGSLLASASDDHTIRIFRTVSGALVSLLFVRSPADEYGNSQAAATHSVVFSSDGSRMASGSADGHTRIWDPISGSCFRSLECGGNVRAVAFSPDGMRLASPSTVRDNNTYIDIHTVMVHNAAGNLQGTLSGHTGSVSSIAFSSDGSQIVSGSDDATVKLWDTVSMTCSTTLNGHATSVTSVAFSPEGSCIASGSSDETINLWDRSSGKITATLHNHSGGIKSIIFSPDGLHLASGSAKGITIWNVASGVPTINILENSGVRSIAFSPDGSMLVSSSDKTVRLWAVA